MNNETQGAAPPGPAASETATDRMRRSVPKASAEMDRLWRWYGENADRRQRRHGILRFATICAGVATAGAAFVALLEPMASYATLAGVLTLGTLLLWNAVDRPGDDARASWDLSFAYDDLKMATEALRRRLEEGNIAEREALSEWESIQRKRGTIESRARQGVERKLRRASSAPTAWNRSPTPQGDNE